MFCRGASISQFSKMERMLKGNILSSTKMTNLLKLMRLQRIPFSTNISICSLWKKDYGRSDNRIRSALDDKEVKRGLTISFKNSILNRSISTGDSSDEFKRDPIDTEFTHFGYEQVKESEKMNKVYNVFEKVADSYDVMNDVMSGGIHRLWKQRYVQQLNVRPGMSILDMAGGTGDIAFKILDDLASKSKTMSSRSNDTRIVISDINQAMLDVGQKRAAKLGIHQSFEWVQANAEELPFEDESIDLYTIAFGIRNTTHIEKVLDEAFRVLKIGGRLSCLEFSSIANPIFSGLYDSYSFQVIPVLGEVIAQDWKSYQYLVESIRQFPKQEDFADMLYDAGFSNVRFENMTFGVVAIHDGFKI